MTFLALMVLIFACRESRQVSEGDYDLLIYGATPAGVITAITAADHGASVLLVEPSPVIGGMYASGLNTAESEHMINSVITGRARDFFIRLGEENYDTTYFQTFGNGRGLKFKPGDPAFFFESKHAEALFETMLEEAAVKIIRSAYLTEVHKEGTKIRKATFSNGDRYAARYFVDCSYEGDLMALSEVSYTHGRESMEEYGESLAGLRLVDDTLRARTVDENGQLLPYFNRYDSLIPGSADKRVMNYNFRPLMTQDRNNMVPIYRPANYDSTDFNFLADFLADNPDVKLGDLVGKYPRGSGKFEFNNQQHALVSLGMFGANADYTEGDWETRQRIYQLHKDWTLGFLYFLASDPRVPQPLREETQSYGFCKDEFVRNDHFPYYLYVREGRRMIGELVQTQRDIFQDRSKEKAVFLGSHWVDSHHVQRIAISDSTFVNEGRIWEVVHKPFEIDYRTLAPIREECTNLVVPVCASFSHVAFCAYRLESTWMQAGHVAGLSVAMALARNSPVQDVDIAELQNHLREEGMIIKLNELPPYDDYDWMATHLRYKDWYNRMYEHVQ